MSTVATMGHMLLEVFAQVPDPKAGGTPLPGLDRIQTLMNWTFIISGVAAVIGITGIGAKMALSHRSNGAENPNLAALGWATAGCVIISVAAAVVNALIG
jgi:hypothetical protein